MMRRLALASALFVAVGSAAPSMAVADTATATSNIGISASVPNNCTISTSPMTFAAYDPIGNNASSDLNITGTVTTTCTSGASATIMLSQGNNAGNGSTDTLPIRQLAAGANKLSYNLYQNTQNTVWANTNETGVSPKATGIPTVMNVFGRILRGQNVPAGNYTDSVQATIAY
ncbi:MAG: spore coat U domain-containing protein [Dolichospermum sp.]